MQIWDLGSLSLKEVTSRIIFFGLILSAFIISAISIINAIKWVDKPFAGFLVTPRIVVAGAGLYQWTGIQAGLKFPDKILTANHKVISSMEDFEGVIQNSDIGEPISYFVERGGKVIGVTIPTMQFTWTDLSTTFGLQFLSGIIYLSIGVIVFILKPDTRVSWAFLSLCFFLGMHNITDFGKGSTGLVWVYILAMTFAPAAGLHLSFVFPEKKKWIERYPHSQGIPYVLSTTLAIPLLIIYPRPAFMPLYQLVLFYLVISAMTLGASTLQAYFKSSSMLARQRAKVVLFGAALAFPVPASVHYMAFFGQGSVGMSIVNNFLPIPIIAFPAAIAYAIAKHNLFDVDVYIKRAVGYGIMTAIVGMGYFSIQTAMSTVLFGPLFGEYAQNVYPLAFALLVVFFFNPINRRIQETVDKIFFRKQFDYKQTISAVSNALTSMLNLGEILKQVVHTVRREMFVDTAGVIVLEPQKKGCQALFLTDEGKDGKDKLKDLLIGYDDPLLALIREEKTLVTKYDIEEDARYRHVKDTCLQTFSDMAASMAIPLLYQSEVTGVLALGYKKSGQYYGREDIDLLITMANQAAVAIQNATTHQEVVRYAEELAASLRRIQILESIKTNLAKFVPKTVHDLIEESPEAPLLEKREADLSVLFADMTGYTRLSAQMELDQVNRLVERYFGAFLDEILREGGDVNETAGDGLMVIFQDPDPRRHARAAALAALGIQRRTWEINAQLRGQSEPITMKVGLNSGIASVGATKIEGAAGTRWTYTASGPTTNVAARLAALGEGGAIVLSDETRRRLGGEFQVEDLGLQSLKNVLQPVRAYRLTGEEPESLDPPARGAAPEEGVAQ